MLKIPQDTSSRPTIVHSLPQNSVPLFSTCVVAPASFPPLARCKMLHLLPSPTFYLLESLSHPKWPHFSVIGQYSRRLSRHSSRESVLPRHTIQSHIHISNLALRRLISTSQSHTTSSCHTSHFNIPTIFNLSRTHCKFLLFFFAFGPVRETHHP